MGLILHHSSSNTPLLKKGGQSGSPQAPISLLTCTAALVPCPRQHLGGMHQSPDPPSEYRQEPSAVHSHTSKLCNQLLWSHFQAVFFYPQCFTAARREVAGNTPKREGRQQHGGPPPPAARAAELSTALHPAAEAKQPAEVLRGCSSSSGMGRALPKSQQRITGLG